MRIRMTIGGALLLLMIAMTAGCEDSDVTAPPGSAITLIPSPASIFIDQDATPSESEGTAALVAQVVDAGGLPLANIPLFFTTDGGQLASVNNICIANACSRTGADCTLDPCVQLPGAPIAIFTNSSGVATDTLLLRLIDPDSVVTTAQGTGLTAMATVTKTVNVGTNPVANIVMSPPAGQLSGRIFLADGAGSIFNPQFDPTCYEWTINSSNPDPMRPNPLIRRSPNLSILDDLSFGIEGDPSNDQTLTVSLRVSDRPSIVCVDDPAIEPDTSLFSDFPASVSYEIRCDLTPPINVDAGPDRFPSLGGNPTVAVTLSAIGSDPQFPNVTFNWNCVDAIMDPADGAAQSVTCTYSDAQVGQSPTAEVTVTNECGLSTTDNLTVNVLL